MTPRLKTRVRAEQMTARLKSGVPAGMYVRLHKDLLSLVNYIRDAPYGTFLGKRGEGSIGGWDYSCCNTSLLSRYENYCITMQIN